MPGWFDRWLIRGPRTSRLAALIADYPRYEVPHAGPGRRLKVAQARDNLRYLLDHREERLQALGALLQNFDIDLRAGLSEADPRPLLDALERWASADWPGVFIAGICDSIPGSDAQRWEESTKAGTDIALSMLMDTAIALGEVVTSRRKEFEWQIDLERSNRGMRSYHRPVVVRSAEPQRQWAAVVLDFEAECINDFDWLGRHVPRSKPLGYTVLAALSGGYDPLPEPTLEQPKAVLPSPASSGVYDKADYHAETVEDSGLPGEQAAVPGAFFLGWVIERNLCSTRFASEKKSMIAAYQQRKTTALDIYLESDGALIADVLNDAGNGFAQEYFRNGGSAYWADYDELFGANLPSLYHAPYGWEQQARINARLDQRYEAWLKGRGTAS